MGKVGSCQRKYEPSSAVPPLSTGEFGKVQAALDLLADDDESDFDPDEGEDEEDDDDDEESDDEEEDDDEDEDDASLFAGTVLDPDERLSVR